MEKVYNVGIIGGGVSGAVTALQLSKYGIDNILFEKEKSLVNGPPFCHLHAGGNLYPDISDEQCKTLMKQSIDMAKLFPQSIDQRPTFISIPFSEDFKTEIIEKRMKMLVNHYKKLIDDDPTNEILGKPENYYKIYNIDDLLTLAHQDSVKNPVSLDQWMINATKVIDLRNLKLPVFLVQEYGWNLFRFGAQAQLALDKTDKCFQKKNTEVIDIKDHRQKKLDYNWEIITKNASYKVNYLVNSLGFKTGKIDEALNLPVNRLIEFKAAYISKWINLSYPIPELIFHGERGTPHGMAQLTPYNGNYYQIHGMTKDITLFDDGLIQSKDNKMNIEFGEGIKRKLSRAWDQDEVNTRTQNAINFIAKFVPAFITATVGGPPLYGAQQIPGDDLSLRVGEVSFPSKSYARSEIVKASSALTVANQIINKIQEEEIIPLIKTKSNHNSLLDSVSKADIDKKAVEIANNRAYPKALARLLIERA